MKRIVFGAMLISSLLVSHGAAQRGGFGGGGGRPGFGGSAPRPAPPIVAPGLGGFRPSDQRRFSNGGYRGFGGYDTPPASYPDDYSGDPYPANRAEGFRPSPNLVVVPPIPPEPPPIVRPVMHEYNWPARPAGSGDAISIVAKDGTVRSAIAVWVQDEAVHYFAPDGTSGRIAVSGVDRETTMRLNAEKHLTLWLPPIRR